MKPEYSAVRGLISAAAKRRNRLQNHDEKSLRLCRLVFNQKLP